MKKLSSIALSLVLGTALMGAGYAAWTQSVTVNGTVSTGKLDFQFSATPVVTPSTNPSITSSGNSYSGSTATVGIGNLYPGAGGTIDLPMSNASTVPATLDHNTVLPTINGLPTGITVDDIVSANVIIGSNTIPLSTDVTIQPETRNFTIEYVVNIPSTLDNDSLPQTHTYSGSVTPVFNQAQ